MQATRVGKVRARAAELGGPIVHHLHERVDVAGDGAREDIGGVVAAGEHETVEQLLDGEHLARLKAGDGAIGGYVGEVALLDGDLLGEVRVLERYERRHDLGGGGGVARLVRVELVENGPRGGLDKERGGRLDGRVGERRGGGGGEHGERECDKAGERADASAERAGGGRCVMRA